MGYSELISVEHWYREVAAFTGYAVFNMEIDVLEKSTELEIFRKGFDLDFAVHTTSFIEVSAIVL